MGNVTFGYLGWYFPWRYTHGERMVSQRYLLFETNTNAHVMVFSHVTYPYSFLSFVATCCSISNFVFSFPLLLALLCSMVAIVQYVTEQAWEIFEFSAQKWSSFPTFLLPLTRRKRKVKARFIAEQHAGNNKSKYPVYIPPSLLYQHCKQTVEVGCI